MRTLNIDELDAVQGGRMTPVLAANIISFLSDAFGLIDAAMKVDYASMVNNSNVEFGNVNPMGDYTNVLCTR
mgnify:CR=1 FL=1